MTLTSSSCSNSSKASSSTCWSTLTPSTCKESLHTNPHLSSFEISNLKNDPNRSCIDTVIFILTLCLIFKSFLKTLNLLLVKSGVSLQNRNWVHSSNIFHQPTETSIRIKSSKLLLRAISLESLGI